eukprot:746824-Karenia_brevis.AAC.1
MAGVHPLPCTHFSKSILVPMPFGCTTMHAALAAAGSRSKLISTGRGVGGPQSIEGGREEGPQFT